MASENITKLRLLVEKLSKNDTDLKNDEYKSILNKVKQIVDFETDKITNEDDKGRLMGYEKMCNSIQIMLNKIKMV
jgi:hypothetical protein